MNKLTRKKLKDIVEMSLVSLEQIASCEYLVNCRSRQDNFKCTACFAEEALRNIEKYLLERLSNG